MYQNSGCLSIMILIYGEEKSNVEVLTTHSSKLEYIWRKSLKRGNYINNSSRFLFNMTYMVYGKRDREKTGSLECTTRRLPSARQGEILKKSNRTTSSP